MTEDDIRADELEKAGFVQEFRRSASSTNIQRFARYHISGLYCRMTRVLHFGWFFPII